MLIRTPSICTGAIAPPPPKNPAILYSEALAGQSSQAKRELLASDLRKRGLDAVLLTQAEPINWLLNLRGRDVERLPVVLGFAVLYANATMDFFVDTDKIDCFAFSQHVGQDVSVYPIDKLGDVLKRIGEDQQKVLADPNTANAWTQLVMEEAGAILVAGQDPTMLPKACKNEVELAGMRAAHLRDGVAVTRFLAWLDRLIASGEFDGVDEGTLADQLEAFRREQEHYVEPSFDTISRSAPTQPCATTATPTAPHVPRSGQHLSGGLRRPVSGRHHRHHPHHQGG